MPRYIDAEKIKYSYLPLAVMPDVFVTKKEIDEMPSEDVAPVVHAHWIAKEILVKTITAKNYICSVCGNENQHYPYCPCCGAKMDEEENEE